MSEKKEFDFVELLTTFNAADIALVKSILDGNDIIYFIQGENFNIIRPMIEPSIFFVKDDQLEKSQDLTKDLNLTISAVSSREPQDDDE